MDRDFNVKIIDFGLSSSIFGSTGKGYDTNKTGTQGFQAPEILHKFPVYNSQVIDVFALGVVLVLLATGIPPFNHAHLKDHRFAKLQEDPDSFWEDYTNWNAQLCLSLEFKSLVQKMLALRPVDRLCIQEVLAHPWL